MTHRTIYAYRPTDRFVDCASVAYDDEGNEVAFWVSSSLSWAKQDLGRELERHGYGEPTWLVGPDAWNAEVDSGRLKAGRIG